MPKKTVAARKALRAVPFKGRGVQRTLAPKTKARSTFEKTAKQFAKKAAGAKLRKTR